MQELGSAATNDLRDAKGGRETMMQDLVAADVMSAKSDDAFTAE